MRALSSALYGVDSPSMRSRDPDGVNPGGLDAVRLEPAGSRSEAVIPGPTDSVFSNITDYTEMEDASRNSFDLAKLVGAPPPPPKNPPPRKNRNGSRKVEQQAISMPESMLENDENDENAANNAPTPRMNVDPAKPMPPVEELQSNEPIEDDDDDDDDDLLSFTTTESHTIDVDEFSIASRSVMGNMENKAEIIPSSPASEVTRPHSNQSHDEAPADDETLPQGEHATATFLTTKDEKPKKEHKRGFFKKLFRGKRKEKNSGAQMDVITEAISQESNAAPQPKAEEEPKSHEPNIEELPKSVEDFLDADDNDDVDQPLVDVPSSQEELAVDVSRAASDAPDGQNEYLADQSSKSAMKMKKFIQDPPDDEHGDPPQYSGPPLISPASANLQLYVSVSEEEEEHTRIESVRSRIADVYDGHPSEANDSSVEAIPTALSNDLSLYGGDISISLQQRPSIDPEADAEVPRLRSTTASDRPKIKADHYEEGLQPTPSSMSQLHVLVQTESVDPVGASPTLTLNEHIRGRPQQCEGVYQDPVGESPMAWKVTNDPVGESPCHAEDLKKSKESFDEAGEDLRSESQDPPLQSEVAEEQKNEEAKTQEEKPSSEQFPTAQNDKQAISRATRAALDLVKTSGADMVKTNNASGALSTEKTVRGVPKPLQERAKDPLSVAAAAFSNAETTAYLHELHGEPSPRHTWHVSKRKTAEVLGSPVSKPKKTPKEILKAKLKEKYAMKQEIARTKAPSPSDYTAENLENMIEREPTPEELLESKDISKFQGFGFKSKFKGRKPTRKKKELESATTEGGSGGPAALQEVDHQVMIPKKEIKMSPKLDVVEVRQGKITAQAVARGLEMRRAKVEEDIATAKPEGRNRFHFRVPASEIKDPIQRASRRLLSKAAVRIQAAARMYLAKREAVDKMWAVLAIQSYCRRWRCEANLRAHVHSVMVLQSVARAWFARQEAKKRNLAAIQIQKRARGYLATVRLYDMMYCLASIQALVRGACVRKKQTQYKAELLAKSDFAIPMQSLIRGYKARKELQKFNSSTCKIQSVWRSYVARIDLQFQIVDIIVVQSVVRRRLACKQARAIKNAPYFLPASKIQARWRGCNARSLHKKMLAARKIQTAWRAFHAYTDYVFALVDILVVQRTVRKWLAVRKVNALRQEKAAIVQQEQEKVNNAVITIQKAWRGFWGFSQYIIVQYEVTRLQAIVRGKLARQNYHLKLGCAIIIQATVRQYLSKKAVSSRMVVDALVAGKAQQLRERNSAKRIQFWWRIVLDWTKEKRAALVIERFFIHVRKEVEREVNRMQRKASMKRQNRKRRESEGGRLRPVPPPACGGLEDVEEQRMVLFSDGIKSTQRSQSAPRPRQDKAPSHRTPSVGAGNRGMPPPSPRRAGRESQGRPVDSVLQLTESNVTDVSGITTPEVFMKGEKGSERRPRERRSAGDYIQKYNRVDSNSKDHKSERNPQKRMESPIPVQKPSQHFFSEERGATQRVERVPSDGKKKVPTPGGVHLKRRASSATPRGHRMPPSPHRMPPSPHRVPSPRRDNRGMPSPRKDRNSYYSPVALKRQHHVIKRNETHETDSMSRSTASRHSRSSSDGHLDRVHRGPAIVMKSAPEYSSRHPVGERHAVVDLGPDYGEV